MKRFYAFWLNRYGNVPCQKALDTEEEVIALHECALANPDSYYNLHIIYGDIIRFEAVEVVKKWRIWEGPPPAKDE